ncbi:MAG: hypothetical protein JWM93_1691 [Frankiales bacterium]|nr:hypothetical protein [Frankiales bacterium]
MAALLPLSGAAAVITATAADAAPHAAYTTTSATQPGDHCLNGSAA